jgi:hypothetical protein
MTLLPQTVALTTVSGTRRSWLGSWSKKSASAVSNVVFTSVIVQVVVAPRAMLAGSHTLVV